MKLGKVKQEELFIFLKESYSEFSNKKELNLKKDILISEYTNFLKNKLLGKTK